ncbi:T9SS type A sorting domain-containing protein [bacterium]|nr:T9SS type A sorting domain-containing protein [bacterium]
MRLSSKFTCLTRVVLGIIISFFIFFSTSTPTQAAHPEIIYSTYFGDNGDERIEDIHVDKDGNVYVVGFTRNWMTTKHSGLVGLDDSYNGGVDNQEGFIAKLNENGALEYFTYIGGDNTDALHACTTDSQGYLYITGHTYSGVSGDFNNLITETDGTGVALSGTRDGIFIKLAQDYAPGPGPVYPIYGAYFGGSSWEYGLCIQTDNHGAAYIGGFGHSDFPVSPGGVGNPNSGGTNAFFMKFSPNGAADYNIEYSGLIAGDLHEPVDDFNVIDYQIFATGHTQSWGPNTSATNPFPIIPDGSTLDRVNDTLGANQGSDGYFTKVHSDGLSLIHSTFIGPEESPARTEFEGIHVDNDNNPLDADGNVFIVGSTEEINWSSFYSMPTTHQGGRDGIVVKLSSDYQTILYASFIGGTGDDKCNDIVMDNTGNYWITGFTNSPDWPNPGDGTGGDYDIFVLYMNKDGNILWSKRYGGDADEMKAHLDVEADVDERDNTLWFSGVSLEPTSVAYPTVANVNPPVNPIQSTHLSGPPLSTHTGSYDGVITHIKAPAVPLPWKDDFIDEDIGDVPGGWEHKTDHNSNRAIFTNLGSSQARIEVAAGETEGDVNSRDILCENDIPWMHINVDQIGTGAEWSLKIYLEEDNDNPVDLITANTKAGIHEVNYVDVLANHGKNWNGQSIRMELTVAGGEGKYIVLDYININTNHYYDSLPWEDHFDSMNVGTVPDGWDYKDGHVAADQAVITYAGNSLAKIKVPVDGGGYVETRKFVYDSSDIYGNVQVDVTECTATNWTLKLKNLSTITETDIITTQTGSGQFSGTYSAADGDELRFVLYITGTSGDYINVDFIRAVKWQMGLEEHFFHSPSANGTEPSGWGSGKYQCDMKYSYSENPTYAAITRTSGSGWGKIISPSHTVSTTNLNYLEISVADISPDTYWSVRVRRSDDNNTLVIPDTLERGIFEVDYITSASWSGPPTVTFTIEINVMGDVGKYIVVDSIKIRGADDVVLKIVDFSSSGVNQLCPYTTKANSLPDLMQGESLYFGHFMLEFGRVGSAWRGWNAMGHDPNTFVDGEQREIAATYYPYKHTSQKLFPETEADLVADEDAPYNQNSTELVQRHIDICNILGLNGAMFDLGTANEIVESFEEIGGVQRKVLELQSGYAWRKEVFDKYLVAINDNLAVNPDGIKYVIPVYEDKSQWKFVNHHHDKTGYVDRDDTVAKAKADLSAWWSIISTSYDSLLYKINDGGQMRPVIYMFCYEEESRFPSDDHISFRNTPDGRGITRLSAVELKAWYDALPDPKPILVTNMKKTNYPYDPEEIYNPGTDDTKLFMMEDENNRYSDIFEGYFEWPEIFGGPHSPYDQYHDLTEEIKRWNYNNLISRYDLELGKIRFLGSGAWPGFDDEKIKNWGANEWRKIPRRSTATDTGIPYIYTYNYHLDRVKSMDVPVKQVVTFNDWWEGANVEPSVDFYEKYASGGIWGASASQNETMRRLFQPVNNARQKIDEMKTGSSSSVNTDHVVLPYWGYTVRKGFPGDAVVQQAADDASEDIAQGNYVQAETDLQYFIHSIQSRTPTPTMTPTSTTTMTSTVSPTVTVSPTITPTPDYAWSEGFVGGVAGNQPGGWEDETDNSSFNSEIYYLASNSYAQVSRTADGTWGKVLTTGINCNVDTYPMVQVNISEISEDTTWKIGIQETEGSWQYWNISSSMQDTGTFSFNYQTVTAWSGTHNFSVTIIVEGDPGKYIQSDFIRVRRTVATQTPTATVTQTATVTPTATPANVYWTDFIGTAGQQPGDWQDETDNSAFDCEISYSTTSSIAEVERTAESGWGKVLFDAMTCDVDVYSFLEIKVTNVDANTSWKLGIQEAEGSYQFWDLHASQTGTDTYHIDYTNITGWTGVHTFQVQITVEGGSGTSITVDHLRVGGDETAQGGVVIVVDTATPTITPTITVSPTKTPTQVPATATPSPTKTVTATPTPWMKAKDVMAYPNPARDKVNFAYTISGQAKVVIDIYKLTGERVANITEHVDGGTGQTLSTAWNAVDVAPGIYFCRIVITDNSGKQVFKIMKKVALIK